MTNINNSGNAKSNMPDLESPEDVRRVVGAAAGNNEITSGAFMELLKILAIREARLAAKEANEERARVAKDKSQQQDSVAYLQDLIRKQSACKHRKGNRIKGDKSAVDYSVYLHTFIDRSQYIKCQICGMKWFEQDTSEFLIRKGRPIPNHTKISWARAVEMFEESSNKASASEIPLVHVKEISLPKTPEGENVPDLQL